jgi:hypothetical protein
LLIVGRSGSKKRQVPGSALAASPEERSHNRAAKESGRICTVREEPESRFVNVNHILKVSELQSYLMLSTQDIEIVVVFESSADLNVLSAEFTHGRLHV